VLRALVIDCLTKNPCARDVQAFCSAAARDGGAGAMLVLLAR